MRTSRYRDDEVYWVVPGQNKKTAGLRPIKEVRRMYNEANPDDQIACDQQVRDIIHTAIDKLRKALKDDQYS